MNARTLRSFSLLLFASFLLGTQALASPAIPKRMRSHLDLECTPKCTTCHDSPLAGRSNASRPFAVSISGALDDAGLDITSSNSIEEALDALAAAGTDSDGDEVSDVDELLRKPPSDPSVAGEAGLGQVCIDPEPTYGCGAQFSSSASGYLTQLLTTLVILGAVFARRLRRA